MLNLFARNPRLGGGCAAFAAFLLTVNALTVSATGSGGSGGPLRNLGFEASPAGQTPTGWSIGASADTVKVVRTEGPGQFKVYAEKSITVAPYRELQALRLGTPTQSSKSQDKGTNQISQRFTPTNTSLEVALRAFSFEHRGYDKIVIDVTSKTTGKSLALPVKDGTGAPFVIPMPYGSAASCSKTPCTLTLNVGKSGAFLDSGWRTLRISGLPTNGSEVVLSYSLITSSSESHPSWVYFDAETNRPPVAGFSFSPGSLPGTVALEGDYLVFDCGTSSDPDGDAIECEWTATGGTITELKATGPVAFFVFPEDDLIQMTLKVSDGKLSTSTSQQVTIDNGAPVIAALDLEVPVGGTGEALCRFLDPGAEDHHTVALSVNGEALTTVVAEENSPSLSSGVGRATFSTATLPAGTYSGECVVTDDDGGVTARSFAVAVQTPAEVAARETADTDAAGGAPVANSGKVHLRALEEPNDIDVVRITLPGGVPLPVGSEINVVVNVPAAYDAILLTKNSAGDSTTPFVNAPFVNAPFVNAPFVNVPFVNVPFVNAPFVNAPFVNVPFVNAPFVNAPFVNAPFVNAPLQTSPFVNAGLLFTQFPLSQVGLAAPDGGGISGMDIALGELGSLGLGALVNEALQVKALSAELGNAPEHMLVRVGAGEAEIYLAIVAEDGAWSSAPYTMSVEVSTPPPPAQTLGANCNGTPLVATGKTTSSVVLHAAASPKTLIITQRERFMATWNLTATQFDTWLASLVPFFDHELVAAQVVSVPSTIFDAADIGTCSVAEQNAAATAVRSIITSTLQATPSIQNVQIIGGPDIVMPYYSPDETTVGFEGLWASELWMQPGRPLAVALSAGYSPTDAFYGDLDPLPFRGRELFIEDVPVGRLVERPEEIHAAAASFVTQGGRLPLSRALATGYDFFSDGTDATADVLDGVVSTTRLNNDNWTAADLRCEYLGVGGACPLVPDLTVLNAHMTYNALWSANGFTNSDGEDVVASIESEGLLGDRLTISIGCHSGFVFPDAWAISPEAAGILFDPGRDWVQEAGTWIGPWTYGYGDDVVADRGMEGIVTLITEELTKGASLGKALVRAKQRYATGLFEFGVYDEKSLIGLGLFGMPQATVRDVSTAPPPPPSGGGGSPFGTFELTLIEQGTTATTSHLIEQVANDRGTYFTYDGDAQAVVGRALQPTTKPFEVREAPGATLVHGVALRAGTFTDLLAQDPVFPTATHDFALTSEPQPCVDTLSPSQLATVTTFESLGRTLQTLIVQGGQFRCTLATEDQGVLPVVGDFRIFDSATLDALHPTTAAFDGDFDPPTVVRQEVVASPTTNNVTATLQATDPNGLGEIIALVFRDDDAIPGGTGSVESFTTGNVNGNPGPHTLVLPNARGQRLAFQYVDRAGNVLLKSQKGALIEAIDVVLQSGISVTGGITTITVQIGGFAALEAPVLTIDFGDGTQAVIPLTQPDGTPIPSVTIRPDGVGLVQITHTYSSTTPTFTVVATVNAGGASGTDSEVFSQCADPAGDASKPNTDIIACEFTTNGTKVDITLYVAGEISTDYRYAVKLPQTNTVLTWGAGFSFCCDLFPVTVTKVSKNSTKKNGIKFSFDAKHVGWDGHKPLTFQGLTHGRLLLLWKIFDTTAVFTIDPP